MEKYGIKITNYKCFKEPIGFDEIKPINVIIGKNNIGKSSLIDMIEFYYNKKMLFNECNRNNNLKLIIDKTVSESDLSGFSNSTHSWWNPYSTPRLDDYAYAKKDFIGKHIIYNYGVVAKTALDGSLIIKDNKVYVNDDDFKNLDSLIPMKIVREIKTDQKITKRIYAERNILPEKDSSEIYVDGHGNGACNIINKFINKDSLDSSKVQTELLNKLNEIMNNEYKFSDIVVQTIEDKDNLVWEIFLEEDSKGRIALSQSGSGLKTIILLLIFTILIPSLEEHNLGDYIFILEEMENNLHPSLQRNVIKYIESLVDNGATFFITTHSNVFIDSYSNSENVNLYHLFKNNDKIKLIKVAHFLDKNSILNDVGFKASDILQANGVIWVEGPSDRIYINKWIDLWSNGTLKEGKDYQCVFYGGKLLSHLTISNAEIDELINLLKVNRNSIILIDSDKKSEHAHINNTKSRIRSECKDNNIMCWITYGREIENYVSTDIISKSLNSNTSIQFNKYDDIKDTLNSLEENLGNKFESDKIKYAKMFTRGMNFDNCKNILDLDANMKKVIKIISEWN